MCVHARLERDQKHPKRHGYKHQLASAGIAKRKEFFLLDVQSPLELLQDSRQSPLELLQAPPPGAAGGVSGGSSREDIQAPQWLIIVGLIVVIVLVPLVLTADFPPRHYVIEDKQS